MFGQGKEPEQHVAISYQAYSSKMPSLNSAKTSSRLPPNKKLTIPVKLHENSFKKHMGAYLHKVQLKEKNNSHGFLPSQVLKSVLQKRERPHPLLLTKANFCALKAPRKKFLDSNKSFWIP